LRRRRLAMPTRFSRSRLLLGLCVWGTIVRITSGPRSRDLGSCETRALRIETRMRWCAVSLIEVCQGSGSLEASRPRSSWLDPAPYLVDRLVPAAGGRDGQGCERYRGGKGLLARGGRNGRRTG